MVWVLYLSIDHRHGVQSQTGSSLGLWFPAIAEIKHGGMGWKSGKIRRNERGRTLEENDQVGFLGWQTRKKNQKFHRRKPYNEAPKTTELTEFRAGSPSVKNIHKG